MASRFMLKSIRNLTKIQILIPNLNKKVQINQILNLNNKFATRAFSTSCIRNSNVMKDLSNFLNEEIKQEQEAQKEQKGSLSVTGFNTKTDGPNVTLSKKHNDEEITIKFNVNGSLDNAEAGVDQPVENKNQGTELKSRPTFSIEVKRGDQTLAFGCSFLPAEEADKEAAEDFQIDEFAIHNGEWNENVYTADCSVLDENLYDLLLNLLDERGVGEKFANELALFSTTYEHQQYINLLEKLQKFAK
ncbi:complement component 1 Q subcomponent-binding mitochondrial [Brachionus plicatilis]|uniref:Complement component 1 Q subcomponent-binding mitochondrial n=1 Tax=Brachionus plicatilis TaxID=10195 RepID=A0A3M7PL94_BRAPC|nr:complement component 1 Q subcomponent-binding mitochondrial [Brachionus plicatilis]